MIMGANIGTSVTNTIVAMGQMGDGDQLERAFAGATVHDMFNFLSVAVLLPVEAITGYLDALTSAMVKNATVRDGDKWVGPVKKLVSPLGKKILIANKDVIKGVAKGQKCQDFYPIVCSDPSDPTKSTCSVGLIGCDKATDECPAFFSVNATERDDKVSGVVCFIMALVILVICLVGLVTLLQRMLLGTSTRIIYKATNINGYLAILIGAGITVLVQSSSITTSALTPIVGMGIIHLEQMLPLTLGANIGTTVTALLASLVSDNIDALQVALAHLFFNITGIIIWYPIPFMRRIPLNAARALGKATRIWRGFPLIYIIVVFFVIPLILLGISQMFQQGTTGLTVMGVFICILLGGGLIYFLYWWRFKEGRAACVGCMQQRQRKSKASKALPDDMDYLKAEIIRLREHTGLSEPEELDDVKKSDEASEEEQPAAAKPVVQSTKAAPPVKAEEDEELDC
jgi:sodium-dependent phosphate cotransporter